MLTAEAPRPKSAVQPSEPNPYADGELWSGAGQFIFGEDGKPTGVPKEIAQEPRQTPDQSQRQ